ncbi:MAG: MBL fold metallo-hydrolase [Actinomycetaceae bacterium]|nr:MBL fold metallo-hydrolase [Actinomycetaceae bacterium]
MRIEKITSPFLEENAYVISAEGSSEALIIDPGVSTHDRIAQYLDSESLHATTVLLTHGHADHIWDSAAFSLPVRIAKPDLYRLENPLAQLPFPLAGNALWNKPEDIQFHSSSTEYYADGLPILMIPAPGHTEGSVVLLTEIPAGDRLIANFAIAGNTGETLTESRPLALTGDVIFAGSVGRTDLPGGDEVQMRHTLRTLSNALDPRTWMLPGHGPATVWNNEIENNPYIIRAQRVG